MHSLTLLDIDTCEILHENVSFGVYLVTLDVRYIAWRSGWNGKKMFIALQEPDQDSKMSRPYLFMKTADNQLVPWVASQTDLLAEDWTIATLDAQ